MQTADNPGCVHLGSEKTEKDLLQFTRLSVLGTEKMVWVLSPVAD